MKPKRLSKDFFARPAKTVAVELLGKKLVHSQDGRRISGIIVETEAYIGSEDRACHASRGKTKRTAVMFGPAGAWYVYMIYGFYYCLNIVTGPSGHASAVLIRALDPVEGRGRMRTLRGGRTDRELASGPGKLCRALDIDKKFNGESATEQESVLFIEDVGLKVEPRQIVKARRIGVDYAGCWAKRLLRFYLKGNINVSKF